MLCMGRVCFTCPHSVFGAFMGVSWLSPPVSVLAREVVRLWLGCAVGSPLVVIFRISSRQGINERGTDYHFLPCRFVSLNQSAATKQIYAHYTCATDTQQIKCSPSPPLLRGVIVDSFFSRPERHPGHSPAAPPPRVWAAVMYANATLALSLPMSCLYPNIHHH
jgi:hypothetical protein